MGGALCGSYRARKLSRMQDLRHWSYFKPEKTQHLNLEPVVSIRGLGQLMGGVVLELDKRVLKRINQHVWRLHFGLLARGTFGDCQTSTEIVT